MGNTANTRTFEWKMKTYKIHSLFLLPALALALAASLGGCSDEMVTHDGSGPGNDAAVDQTTKPDLRADVGPINCGQPPQAPKTRLQPAPGEVLYVQIGLTDSSMGESAVIVGPGGKIVLVDVGNDSHDDEVRQVLSDLITQINAKSGFAKRAKDTVNHILITHFHSDHADGMEDLLQNVTVSGKVVHRGYFDMSAVGQATVVKVCTALSGAKATQDLALCDGPKKAPCGGPWYGDYSSTGCPGLLAGDLTSSGGTGGAFLPLSGGARLNIVAINGTIGQQRYEKQVKKIKSNSNGENARSLVGMLRHGNFSLLFGGDLTGGGLSTNDMEGFYITRMGSHVGPLGLDVLQVNHHGSKTSSSKPWISNLLPADGRSRNAVLGVSNGHGGFPPGDTLATVLDNNRLREGRAWTTNVAPGGSSHPKLVTATGGHVLVGTIKGGRGYVVQAVDLQGVLQDSRAFWSVKTCP